MAEFIFHGGKMCKLSTLCDRLFSLSVFLLHLLSIFCSSWSRGISKKSCKEICIACSNFVFKKSFPQLQERDIKRARYCQQHHESVNVKTFDQSEYDTRIWYHGTVAPKACLQAPLLFPPNPLLGSLCSPIFSLFDSNFCLSPLCGAWSQASYQVVSSMPITSDLQLGLYQDLGLELGPHSWVTTHSLLPSFVYHCAAY